MEKQYIKDDKQQAVIDFNDGYALVLAAPGCGKTEILSRRVLKAHNDYDINYHDMLCVTFTNRASREMKERVKEVVGDDVMGELFVGNLHRFCINFLYENELIPIDTSIIDDDDQLEIIEEIKGYQPKSWDIRGVLGLANLIEVQRLGLPKEFIIHKTLDEQYREQAENYISYKKDNKLMDFDDILLLTYKALMEPDYREKYTNSSYKWIQVDEVQDLNPLQLAIIEKLTATDFQSAVYLGDERQAIYSFLGSKHDSIVAIERKCGDNVFTLSNNYRAPAYLLDMLNDYAIEQLKVNEKRLPQTSNKEILDDALTVVKCNYEDEQYDVVATLARVIYEDAPNEKVGILVRTNADVKAISDRLTAHDIAHLKTTNKDMFKAVPFKTLYAHFSVIATDTRFSEWARMLYQVHAIDKISYARRCVRKMRDIGLTPVDLLTYDDSSYFMEFCKAYDNKEIVVFDTETTGLNVFGDDIIQIAAMKVRQGQIIPGSELDIIIKTDKTIPPTLRNNKVNPMVEEYRRRSQGERRNSWEKFMEPQEAFETFLRYIGDDDLLGHNINYDIHILQNNIYRRTCGLVFHVPTYWDTLKMSRMLDPNLRKHNLESLLQIYRLEGQNSHNAMDDINATRSLLNYCHRKMLSMLESQRIFLEHKVTKQIQQKLRRNYLPLYKHTIDKLYSNTIDEEHSFDFEFNFIYQNMVQRKFIDPIERFDYMRALFNKVVVDPKKEIYFNQQLLNHIYELRTFNEADLYQNSIIKEQIHIMTIHKAKGLEFDNVLVYNVSYGVYPHYRAYKKEEIDESARVLYVAMSRAKKRLFMTYQHDISSFLGKHDKVMEHFYNMPQGQKERLLKFEDKFVKFKHRND